MATIVKLPSGGRRAQLRRNKRYVSRTRVSITHILEISPQLSFENYPLRLKSIENRL